MNSLLLENQMFMIFVELYGYLVLYVDIFKGNSELSGIYSGELFSEHS